LWQLLHRRLRRGSSRQWRQLRNPRRGGLQRTPYDECGGELLQHRVKRDDQCGRSRAQAHRPRKRVGLEEARCGSRRRWLAGEAPADRPRLSVAMLVAATVSSPFGRRRRLRRLRRRRPPLPHVAAPSTTAIAPGTAPTVLEMEGGTFHRCLQSRARCRNPLQWKQPRGSLHVATLCAVERQLKHFPCRSVG
jgi:hypothetical protein